jgi:glycerol uptake facilitator-like aquaporin
VIFGGLRARPEAVPTLVALYITGAYWFTSSTSFANPAVTIARGFSDTFAGINPGHIPMFILAQLLAVGAAHLILRPLLKDG